MLVAGKTIHVR